MAKIVYSKKLVMMPQSRFQVQRPRRWVEYSIIVIDTQMHLQHSIQCDSYREVEMMCEWDDKKWGNWLATNLLINVNGK
jgi:hypothetical protein